MRFAKQMARYSGGLLFTLLVGGDGLNQQFEALSAGPDAIIATPGRLMHLLSEVPGFGLSQCAYVVFDEADRLFELGFAEQLHAILGKVPESRQTLLFSATLEGRVLKVANQLLKKPESIALAASNRRHKSIQQHMHHADSKAHKQKLLEHHLESGQLFKSLVFTATKRGAEQVAKVLRGKNIKSAALHGDMSQNKRRQTVENLRKGRIDTLVATDVAARGLDIKDISHVINYDLPTVAEDYIHRIGRTGRASATGCAISLVGPADWTKLSQIEKLIGQKVKREVVDGLEPTSGEPKPASKPKRKAKPRRRFSKGAKQATTHKPGSWRQRQAGPKRSRSARVKKAA